MVASAVQLCSCTVLFYLTCLAVCLQYGMASDDSLNDYSFDDLDSSSSEICRVDHSPCLVSLPMLTVHEHDMPKTVSQTLLSFCLTYDSVQMTGTHAMFATDCMWCCLKPCLMGLTKHGMAWHLCLLMTTRSCAGLVTTVCKFAAFEAVLVICSHTCVTTWSLFCCAYIITVGMTYMVMHTLSALWYTDMLYLVQESTVLNKACDSLFDVQATNPITFPKTCAFPLPLDSLPCGFYSSFPSPLASNPTHPFASPVSSPDPAYNPAIHSPYMDYNLHVNGPALHCPTPPLGPQLGSLRPINPNNRLNQPPFLLHQLQMQSFTQTGSQCHGGSIASMYTMEHAMDPHHKQLGNTSLTDDHSYSSLQGSAELSADMQTLSMNANPINGPEELLHRVEAHGYSEMKYTDWHRYTSAAVPSSPPQEGCISRLGTASNGVDLSASPVWSACSPRAGTLLPKSLFNNLDGADFGLDTRESSTYPACTPQAGGLPRVGALNKPGFSTDIGMDRHAGRGMEGFKSPDRADEHPLLLSQASQPMPGGPYI